MVHVYVMSDWCVDHEDCFVSCTVAHMVSAIHGWFHAYLRVHRLLLLAIENYLELIVKYSIPQIPSISRFAESNSFPWQLVLLLSTRLNVSCPMWPDSNKDCSILIPPPFSRQKCNHKTHHSKTSPTFSDDEPEMRELWNVHAKVLKKNQECFA